MTINMTADEEAILTRLKTLVGGRVIDFIPDDDDEIVVKDIDSQIKAYITVAFGALYRSGRDRTITGEEDQPQVWPVSITCWGKNGEIARQVANSVRPLMLGWAPSDNCSGATFGGGGSFSNRDAAARPSRAAVSVNLEYYANLSMAS